MTPSPEVVQAAQAAQRKWRVPASASLGQYGLESGWGAHMPGGSANPFGIKARKGEPSVSAKTSEFVHGRWVRISAPFRKFADLAEAFEAHARLIATVPVYLPAMQALPDLGAFVAKLAAHYATDPHYASSLMHIIDASDLRRFDVG